MKMPFAVFRFAIGLVFCGIFLPTVSAHAADKVGEIAGQIVAPVAKLRANAVVYVKNAGLGTSSKTVTLDQKGLVFIPRILPIQKGTTVEFRNSDPVAHNVFTPDDGKYDLGTWPQGQSRPRKFDEVGVFRQLCHLHADMIAFIVVLETKYFALSDKDGRFNIKGLPPGTYTLVTWHEKLAAKDATVEVKAGGTSKIEIPLEAKR